MLLVLGLSAQTTDGLEAYYDFNDSTANDQILGDVGLIIGDSQFVCGVDGVGLLLNGTNSHVLLLGSINNQFENDDFTLGFFINPVSTASNQTIFSKKVGCNDDNAFAVRYLPGSNTIVAELSETPSKKTVVTGIMDFDKCWQQVTIVRNGGTVRLYINGILKDTKSAISRIDLSNERPLSIAEGDCVGVTDSRFGGALDEVRLYDRALSEKEVEGLYEPLIPDNIITEDTTLFLGNDVQLNVGNTCVDEVSWMPADFLDDASLEEPLSSPTSSIVYHVQFIDDVLACTAFDSIRITVIDPADLDCGKVFMPNAFTPNNDGRNDTYGISNPYAVSELISFEILDRWGGRVFMTTNPFEQWNGSFKGKEMNSGVLLYRVVFRCEGEELVDVGSLSIIR